MVLAVSRIGGAGGTDYEYYIIMQELRALGLYPTGDKAADKAKLAQARAELVNKIADKRVEQADPNRQAVKTYETKKEVGVFNDKKSEFENVLSNTEAKYPTQAALERERLGAMTVAQLNRIYFGL